jgi:hypothetical protein
VNVWPAAVIVPVRPAPAFAAALNCTAPGPVPPAPDVMLSHAASAFAVHAHPAVVVTLNDPWPPPDGTVWLAGASENVQPPACTTVKVSVSILTVPRRSAPVFGATAICTVPLPLPLDEPEMLIHDGSWLLAFHEQPALVVIATGVVSPPLATFLLVGAIE